MRLVEFCARQKQDFHGKDWLNEDDLPRDTLAVTAAFLALDGESWFGYREELERVHDQLAPGHDFTWLVKATGFDFQRFRGLLRARIAHACALS